MRVQHNIPAMNAYRNYNNNSSGINKNLEKLSSGYKINRAGDDAAGLAISEKMRAQITGLEVAQKNAKDGISLVQTAEGALTEVQDMLNRMYKLAEQSANGTFDSTVDRAQLDKEVNKLRKEIDRIATTANFNGRKLLNGDLSTSNNGTTQADGTTQTDETSATATATVSAGTANLGSNAVNTSGITDVDAMDGATILLTTRNGNALFTYVDDSDEDNPIQTNLQISGDGVTTLGNGSTAATLGTTTTVTVTLPNNAGTIEVDLTGVSSTSENQTSTITLAKDTSGGTTEDNGAPSLTGPLTGKAGTVDTAMQTGRETTTWSGSEGLTLWIGAEASKENALEVNIESVKSEALKISSSTVDISSQAGALNALVYIEDAINKVSDIRGELGATQNRLEHTINNLSVMQENMQDAESSIRDTDVAEEMMKYTKNSILVQSAQAMLAQANQLPQGVLQLLQ